MNVLVTGASGQLGQYLKELCETISHEDIEYIFCSHNELDITDTNSIKVAIEKYKPKEIINCAAYTNVDMCEEHGFGDAYNVNYNGVVNLVDACNKHNILLMHISSDYVFGKTKYNFNSDLYYEYNIPCPINKYGETKGLADTYIVENSDEYVIFRVSGLFSHIGKNFVKRITEKIVTYPDGSYIPVVNDQFVTPVSCDTLGKIIIRYNNLMLGFKSTGIKRIFHIIDPITEYNLKGNNALSWYNIATIVLYYCKKHGLIEENKKLFLEECSSDSFPIVAKRGTTPLGVTDIKPYEIGTSCMNTIQDSIDVTVKRIGKDMNIIK